MIARGARANCFPGLKSTLAYFQRIDPTIRYRCPWTRCLKPPFCTVAQDRSQFEPPALGPFLYAIPFEPVQIAVSHRHRDARMGFKCVY
jgi:hypothetical protein